MELIRYVDLEEARRASGVRLLAAATLPSPWTEAVKGVFHVKQVPILAVRYKPRDAEQMAWSQTHNTPAVFFDDELPRTGWAEILVRAERLGLPLEPPGAERARMFGLIHELAGEWGLGWCSRLIMIDGGISSEGKVGFPLRVSQYLAPKYGHQPGCTAAARRRLLEIFALFEPLLKKRYLLGDTLSALDIYLATFLTPLAQITQADCPGMAPVILPAFGHLHAVMGDAVPPRLLAHRRFIHEQHLPTPIVL